MGFHSYTKPSDYVTCYHTARQGIYEDGALTSSAVRIKFGYAGGPISDTFGRADSTAGLSGTDVEVGSVIAGVQNHYHWNAFPVGSWGVTSGKAYNSTGGANDLLWVDDAAGFLGIPGRLDADISCDVTPTVKAGIIRMSPGSRYLRCALDVAADTVTVFDAGGAGPGLIFTASTTVTSGVTYALRMVNVGSTYSVYVDGVLKGTFTDTWHSAIAPMPGLVANSDSGARFANFVLAKASNPVASTYTVRNYAGTSIKTGSVTDDHLDIADSDLTVDGTAGHKYGWYKLYLTGADHSDGQWGTAYGDCTFIRIPTYSGFATNPGRSVANIQDDTDEIARGVMATGINRYAIANSATAAATSITALTPAVTRMKTYWLDTADAARPRKTLVAFPNGTLSANNANITAIVTGLKTWVNAWESLNEPNFSGTAANFVINHLHPFYDSVKAGDSTAVVMAPGSVSFGAYGSSSGGIQFFKDFLAAGGDSYCDAYSVHPYNCYNGDLPGMRQTITALLAEITAHGTPAKDIYMTEQGFGHAYAGIYWPHYAARWTALMVFAQEVLTLGRLRYENSYYWYDLRHGFDSFPMWWLDTAGPGPQPCAIRTMAGETRGKTITSELDFGTTGKQMYCGGVWTDGSTGDKVIGVIGASYGMNDIRFAVTGSATFTRVDSWGNATTLTVSGGTVTFPVTELGSWLRVPSGTTAALVAADWSWGTNYCAAGTATTSATSPASTSTYQNLAGMHDETYENRFMTGDEPVITSATGNPFAIIEQNYPMQASIAFSSRALNRFVVFCEPPWHDYGTMLDFDLQTYDGATWTTRQTWTTSDVKSFAFTGVDRCTYETFWDDQWIFEHKAVTPITCQGVRVNCRTNSYGGFANKTISDVNNGQGGYGYYLFIRELQAFNVDSGNTLAWTEADDALVAAASSTTATFAATEDDDTLAAIGAYNTTSTMAWTEDDDTFVVRGTGNGAVVTPILGDDRVFRFYTPTFILR